MDVAKRYDVDGLHIDDYFYPYPEYLGKGGDFPDADSYARYQKSGGKLTRADWRRENINLTIQRIYEGLKKEKRWVKFGISPFGLAHNRPPMVKGFDPYDKLYADTELWLKNGWCDYLTPQLYWKTTATSQPFEPLVNFWVGANPLHRNLWPGLFTGRVEAPVDEESSNRSTTRRAARDTAWSIDEILEQVRISHETPGSSGAVHFSMKCLMDEKKGIAEALKAGPYADPALVPASSWLTDQTPGKPNVSAHTSGDGIHVTWTAGWGEKPWLWAVWEKHGDSWRFHAYPAYVHSADLVGASRGLRERGGSMRGRRKARDRAGAMRSTHQSHRAFSCSRRACSLSWCAENCDRKTATKVAG